MTQVTIRRYHKNDIDAILILIENFLYQERDGVVNHFNTFVFDKEKVRRILTQREKDKTFFCSVVVKDDVIVGGLAGSLEELVFSPQLVAVDWLMYFAPEFSSVRAILKLITMYVTWATKHDAVEIQFANSTGYKQEQYGKLMKLAGFEKFSVGFCKRM